MRTQLTSLIGRTPTFAGTAPVPTPARAQPLINPRGLTTLAPGIVGGIAFAVVYGSLASTGGDPINRFLGIKEGGGH